MTTPGEQAVIDAGRVLVGCRYDQLVSIVDAFNGLSEALEALDAEDAALRELVKLDDRGAARRDAKSTSQKAADTIPNRGSLRYRVWHLMIQNERNAHNATSDWPIGFTDWPIGFTDWELESAVNRPHTTVSSCRRDLVLFGLITDGGERRFRPEDEAQKYPSIVWVLTERGKAAWQEATNGPNP